MDYKKISDLEHRASVKKTQYDKEKDYEKKRRYWLELQILNFKSKLERLKKN